MKTFGKIFAASLLMIAFSFTVKAQAPKMPIDETTKLITYTGVVNTPGSKDSLYMRCLEWINSFYKNPTGVTEKRDRENGEFVCKHQFEVYNYDKDGNKIAPAHGMVKYTLNIVFKDGKYRYEITKINLKSASYYPIENWLNESPKHDDHLKQVDKFFRDLEASLKKGMTPKAAAKKTDW